MSVKSSAKSAGDAQREGSLTLTKPHLSSSRAMAAREAIIQAVNVLEGENEELRRYNARILSELEEARQENADLRLELESGQAERDQAAGRVAALDRDNKRLLHELENQARALHQEKQKISIAERQLVDENEQYRKQADQMKAEIYQKENETRILAKELDILRREVDKSARANISDRDFEIMHELECLKSERKDLIVDREEMHKNNSKLRNELKNLEIQLEEKASELKNENRRHSLLTKEFNSLLEENNHLKLQLRRRNQRHSIAMTSRDDTSVSSSGPEVKNSLRSSRKYNSSVSLNRDPSLTSLDRVSLRDSSLGRSHKIARESNHVTTSSTPRDSGGSNSSFYAQPHHTARDLAAGGKRQTRDLDRGNAAVDHVTSSSPDTLPSIPGSSKTTGTWKP